MTLTWENPPVEYPPTTAPVCYKQVERHIRRYPQWMAALREMDSRFEAECSGGALSDARVQGGVRRTSAEKIVDRKEGSPRYVALAKNCAIMDTALKSLSHRERIFVCLFWWEDLRGEMEDGTAYSHAVGVAQTMGKSEATVWRWRRYVLRRIEPLIRAIDPHVE